jgi:predicted helicase
MYARFYRWASDRLDANGVLAFVTNRSFLDSRTFDGFRKTVAGEFAEVRVVDLGGDVRANPKLSGTRHNVFGIQTGVAIAFFVKKPRTTRDHRCRIFYTRRPESWKPPTRNSPGSGSHAWRAWPARRSGRMRRGTGWI